MNEAEVLEMLKIANRCSPAATANWLTSDLPKEERFTWPQHIDFISLKVTDAVAGRCPRLIVTIPPQHGKSFTISKWTPVWFLENFPTRRILLGSYSGEYAEVWGRRTRDALEAHKNKLSVRVSGTSASAGEWETTRGGGMTAVGVGGSATGRSADLLIIDDPHKDAAEANSQTIRNKVWDWFTSVAMTRLGPSAPAIIIQTRWHPDDLTGRIVNEMKKGGPKWEIINLPAIAEANDPLGRQAGDALWPERYNVGWLSTQKKLVGSYVWNALYQGHPTAPEGGYFKRAWFETVDRGHSPTEFRAICRFWDLAGTIEGEKGNTDPDWTVGCKVGITRENMLYILDVKRFRDSPGNVQRIVRQCAVADGPSVRVRIEQEPGSAGKTVISHYQRNVLMGFDCRGVLTTLDKVTKSGPFNAACERGDVKVIRAPWNDEFLEELAGFPNANHDDQVDAAVGAFIELAGTSQKWDGHSLARIFSYRQEEGPQLTMAQKMLAQNGVTALN